MSASGHCLVPVMTAPNEPPCLHLGCEAVDGRAVAPILLHGQLFWGRKQVLVTQAPPTNMASDAALAGDPRRETPLRTAEREDCPLLGDEMQILSHHKLPLCVRTRLDARGEFEFHGCFLWAFVSVPTNLDEITHSERVCASLCVCRSSTSDGTFTQARIRHDHWHCCDRKGRCAERKTTSVQQGDRGGWRGVLEWVGCVVEWLLPLSTSMSHAFHDRWEQAVAVAQESCSLLSLNQSCWIRSGSVFLSGCQPISRAHRCMAARSSS